MGQTDKLGGMAVVGRFKILSMNRNRYYSKIKEYVNKLPQGTKFTSLEIANSLDIKHKYVIKVLRKMSKKGETII